MKKPIRSFTFSTDHTFLPGFFKKYPQYLPFKKSKKDLVAVIKKFHENYVDEVIDNRQGAELPLLMGKFSILAYKSKGYLDFSQKKLGIITRHINTHTDGLTCKLSYERHSNRYRFKDKAMWTFIPSCAFKKRVSSAFLKQHTKYIYSPDRVKPFYDALDFKLKDINDRKIEEYLKDYDELYIE